ncbi:MAG: ABC transporter ATP-binding protein [Oscillospiraceae bacterium]|nr:ABC transporter ATP-binding protein [Oscillospiraceae bacterium]
MIEVSGLTKSYGKNRGINDVSFSINEGQIVGFLGPNGAGKTTTMNILTGYLIADKGDVKVAGIDILKEPLKARRLIGYLPEQPPLYLTMTVKAYLNFIAEMKKVKKATRDSHIGEICEMVGITGVFSRVIGHLSKGYKQRVGLAGSLIGDPEVLVLDEPTIGLDPRQIVEIRNVIKKMGKERTIILSSHILPEVSAICDRILVISDGVIVADGKPDDLAVAKAEDYTTLIVRVADTQSGIRTLLNGIDGVRKVSPLGKIEAESSDFILECDKGSDIRKALFRTLAKADCPILMLRPQKDSLEDIFLKLTEKTAEEEVS